MITIFSHFLYSFAMGRKEKKRSKEAVLVTAAEPLNEEVASPSHNLEDDRWIDAMGDDEFINLTASELRRLIAEKFEAGKREALRQSMGEHVEEYVPTNVDGSTPPDVAYVPQALPSSGLGQFRESEIDNSSESDKASEEDSVDELNHGDSAQCSAEGNGDVSTVSNVVQNDHEIVDQTNAMAALSVDEQSNDEKNATETVDRSKGAIPKQQRVYESPSPIDDDTIELHSTLMKKMQSSTLHLLFRRT